MLESTYADQDFLESIKSISASNVRIATAIEALANQVAMLNGFVRQRFGTDQRDFGGFVKPV